MSMTLSHLPAGCHGRVISVKTGEQLRNRLEDLGLMPGTLVTCRAAPQKGKPGIYVFRSTCLALRRQDGECIDLKEVEP